MSFGKTAVPASGFGAPTAPAPGGFGKAPAAAGGFGAPAAGGFGSAATAPAAGGFGKAPAAGGFGAAPAAGGFGSAAPPAAGGFGKAPAASGFGAPAAGGFGAPAAGGFGAPAAGGFGAPAAGGFGAPAGGFAKAPVAPGPQLAYTGITGPGYTAPNAPSWITGTDLSQVTDDTLVSKLPQNLRQHLGQLLEFGEKERNARNEINHMYQQLQADSNPTGLRALQQRLESLTSSSSRGVDQLVVDVYHRDKTVKQLLQRSRDAEDSVTTYTRDVWDRIHREGAEYWQQKLNSREGPSTLLRNMMTNTEQVMAEVDHAISDLAAALAPLRRQAGGASMSPNPQQAASSSSGGQAQYMSSAIASYRGAPPGADGNTALLAYGASSTAGGAGAFDFPTATPLDATQVVQGSLQQSMAAFIALGETISSLHSRTNQVRDHVARYYGEAEAEELFLQVPDSDEAAVDAEANAFVTLTIGDTMKGRMHQVSAASRGARGNAAASFLPGITVPRHTMRYDPQLEQAGNVAPASGAAAPAVAAGGFGSAPGAVPTTGGFGAAPAAGAGFGTQPSAAAAPPATAGFGAKAPPTTGGFGASAPATTVGFAAGTATTPGGPAAPLSNPQGFGATPAPSGGFGAATPGTGATPSMITPSLPGMSPSPAGPVAFGSSPSPTAAASPDDGRPANRPRKR